jgi:hypothetical protein
MVPWGARAGEGGKEVMIAFLVTWAVLFAILRTAQIMDAQSKQTRLTSKEIEAIKRELGVE